MDVVYVCRAGENPELRYSLRSLINVPHGQVWIVGGEPPAWVTNVTRIATWQGGPKYEVTTNAVRTACLTPEISDPFWLWNDDFYALEPAKAEHHHRGPVRGVLDGYARRYPESVYTRGMRETLDQLEAHGYADPLSYELHVPLIVHKAPMLTALELGEDVPVWHKRTAYGAVANVGGAFMEDCKVYDQRAVLPVGPWLSSCDSSFPSLRPMLLDRFPERGVHEK